MFNEYEEEFLLNDVFKSLQDKIYIQNNTNNIKGGGKQRVSMLQNQEDFKKLNKINNRLKDIENNSINGFVYVSTNYIDMKQNIYNIGSTNSPYERKKKKNNPFTDKNKQFTLVLIECDFMNYKDFEKELHTSLNFCCETKNSHYKIKYKTLLQFL